MSYRGRFLMHCVWLQDPAKLPCGGVPLSPWTDLTQSSNTFVTNADSGVSNWCAAHAPCPLPPPPAPTVTPRSRIASPRPCGDGRWLADTAIRGI